MSVSSKSSEISPQRSASLSSPEKQSEIEKKISELDLPPASKKVLSNLQKHIAYWSLESVRPSILRWILMPFTLPIMLGGALFYGFEMAYSTMPEEKKGRWMFYCYHREHPLLLRALVFGVSFPFVAASVAFQKKEGTCTLNRDSQ